MGMFFLHQGQECCSELLETLLELITGQSLEVNMLETVGVGAPSTRTITLKYMLSYSGIG